MDMERNLPLSSGGVSTNFFSNMLKEFYAQLSLEHLDLQRNRRRGQERALAGFFHAAVFGDQAKAFELPKFHKKT